MKTIALTFIIFLTVVLSPVAYSQCADTCNIYSFTYSEKSYEIIKELKTWEDASQCAVERGGYLVHIDSLGEQTAVYNAILSSGISSTYINVQNGGGIAYIWIGATDKNTEGAWLWDGDDDADGENFWNGEGANGAGDGTVVPEKYVNWGGTSAGTYQEPDNFSFSQHSAAIGLTGWPSGTTNLGVAGEWNDIIGTTEIFFIVEYDTLKPAIAECIPDESYQPVLEESNSWNILQSGCETPVVDSIYSINQSTEDYKYYATIYNGGLLNKLGTVVDNPVFGKAFYIDNSGKTYPVYDNSLVPGDTLRYINSFDNEIEIIVSDTFSINSLKHIEFNNDIEPCGLIGNLILIESIGPNIGIHSMATFDPDSTISNYLLCNYKSGEFFYGNDLFNNECNIRPTNIETNVISNKPIINLQQDKLLITNYLGQGEFAIFNIQGQKLYAQILTGEENIINISHLKPGIFIYKILIGDKLISDKFIRY